jgi:crossover junction endodeoxyribonuclease RuvC
MRILGIDPGTSRIGYGLIDGDKSKLIRYGVIEAKEKELTGKIANLTAQLRILLSETSPDLIAIEKLYFAKNQKTAMDVAQARGAILSICLEKKIPTVEYSPNEVKSQVAGYGLADKKAVAKMVRLILKVESLSGYDDASDALAIALTAAGRQRFTGKDLTA